MQKGILRNAKCTRVELAELRHVGIQLFALITITRNLTRCQERLQILCNGSTK